MPVVPSPEDATRQRKILMGILEAALVAYWQDEITQRSTARARFVAGVVTDDVADEATGTSPRGEHRGDRPVTLDDAGDS